MTPYRLWDDGSWISESNELGDIEAEICFTLTPKLYTGDPNNHAAFGDPGSYVPIELPPFPRVVPTLARSAEAVGHEMELAHYFAQLEAEARKHGKRLPQVRHLLWLRLWLWNTAADVHVSFPWYDTLDEISPFLQTLRQEQEGEVFWDVDQGWEFRVWSACDRFHILDRDPDYDELRTNLSLPRVILLEQLDAAEARMRALIATLRKELRWDAWTSSSIRDDRRWWKLGRR